MTLTMTAVLSLAAQCAPAVAPDTVASVAMAESGLNPLAIYDNTTHRTIQIDNPSDAVAVATDLIVGRRHSVDLGLMQLNSTNLAAFGLPIADAFDACRSIEVGARLLSEAYQRALRGALSIYNTGDLQRGIANGYVSRVERTALSVPPIARGASVPFIPPSLSPKPAAGGWDVFAQSGGTPFVFTGK